MRYNGFVGPSYLSISPNVNSERSVNLYPEVVDAGNPKSPMHLVGTPGDTLFVDLGQGPVRGMAYEDGRAFAVAGGRFFEVFANGTSTNIGPVAIAGDAAQIVLNGKQGHQAFTLSGGRGYIYDLVSAVFGEIASPGFPVGATQAGFIDGYYVLIVPGTSIFGISSLFNGLNWDTLDRAIRSTAPDNLVGMQVDHRELWLLGSERGEVWVDSGNPSFPLEPLRGTTMQVGLFAPASFVKIRDEHALAWVGLTDGGPRVWMAKGGYEPKPISTNAVDRILQGYGDDAVRQATAYSYQEHGHAFYVLLVPTAPVAWVYDVSDSEKAGRALWHERARWNQAQGKEELPTGQCHMYAFGRHLVGSRDDGKIYSQSLTTYTEHGNLIRRIRRAPYIASDKKQQFHRSFELDYEPGVALVAGQGSDPEAVLRWTNDSWATQTLGRAEKLGKVGETQTQAIWSQLGASRNRAYELEWTEPIACRLTDAFLDVSLGVF